MQQEANDGMSNAREGSGYDVARDPRNTAESERTLGANDVRTVNGVKYEGQAPVASNF